MQATRLILALLLLVGVHATAADTHRAEIHINTTLQVHHVGTSNYSLWGSPQQYESEVIRSLNDVLQAKGIERVTTGADFIVTVDRMTLRETTKTKTLDDPNRPGLTAKTHVAAITVKLSGTIVNKRTGKTKRWRRTVQRSEQVGFKDGNRPGRPSRLEKKHLAPNVCTRLSRKAARKAARRIARKMKRMD